MPLRFVPPQLATLVDRPPVGDQWIFEIKYDGYRLEAIIEHGRAKLLTRRGNDWTAKFPAVAKALTRLPVDSAILDGEVVALDAGGKSSFGLLQQSIEGAGQTLVYFVFDLMSHEGSDLRELPFAERRVRLEKLLRRARMTDRGPVRLGQQLEGTGEQLLRAACGLGLEGIIGKQLDAPYRSARVPSWVKVKCGRRQEFVVIGYTPPKGSRVGIGSLLLAVNEPDGLRYAGRVGSGMPEATLSGLLRQLKAIERSDSPLARRTVGIPGVARWVDPKLVAEVAFTEWTEDGLLRHPVFQGLRTDKPAGEVRREEAMPVAAVRKRTGKKSAEPQVESRTRPAAKTSFSKTSRARKSPAGADDNVVAGVTITHPERMVYPEAGISKLELARYYEHVAPLMLPEVTNRPLAMVRCPEGTAGQCFFQKHWPTPQLPKSIDTVPILQGDGRKHPHVVIHDLTGLITLVQWGVMEIHPWGSRADDPEKPDRIIFDLDPGPGVSWDQVKEATGGIRALLDGLGLASWLKTSGGKGLHVVVPIARRSSWDDVSDFARAVAEHMERQFPDRFISRASKAARQGVIFVDWLRNTRGATAVGAWSTRARPRAGVSMPIPWSSLGRLTGGDVFTVNSVLRAPLPADAWKEMGSARQGLSRSLLARMR